MDTIEDTDPMNETLDPPDWDDFRRQLHQLADACASHFRDIREHGWRPFPEALKDSIRLSEPVGTDETVQQMVSDILPYGSGNTHPRFFGWVQGSGTAVGFLAEMVAAAMNSNCGGRDHGAVYIEREVVRWCKEVFGLPQAGSGVLVSGTSHATVLAFAAARQWKLGDDSRRNGISGHPQLTFYAVNGVHNAIRKAAELVGVGSDAVRLVPANHAGSMLMPELLNMLDRDRKAGFVPCCVVGTAGSVDRGAVDPLREIARICRTENLWFHVDGAFGAWARIAGSPWSETVDGIDAADSIALDFHKWMFVQYDCGILLMRDESRHRATFAVRPPYLVGQDLGLAAGDPWFCDYGIDLSRSFRALKVWATLRAYGTERLGRTIGRNCELAHYMGELISKRDLFQLEAPVQLNVCCFRARGSNDLNRQLVQTLQLKGEAFFSNTVLGEKTVIRAAITNHRTRRDDIERAVAAVVRERKSLGS